MLIFRGEHRVVSFLQLSEISFTRDTHGAVAHMARENIVRSCKGQHPIQNFFASICICIIEKEGMLLVVICSRCLYHNLHVYLYFWLYLQIQRMVGSCTRSTPETFCAAQKLLCAPFSLFWRLFPKNIPWYGTGQNPDELFKKSVFECNVSTVWKILGLVSNVCKKNGNFCAKTKR